MSVLSGEDGGPTVVGQSNLGYNKVRQIARELVAGLTDFRHEGEFKVTWDNKLYDVAHTLTDLDENWYLTCGVEDPHRAAAQYAVATGTAYFWQTWDRAFHSPQRGDIRLSALAPMDVTFIQLPKDHNIQRAYGVLIREELPINLAKAIYGVDNPRFAASLVPDRDAPGWLQRGLQKVQQFLSPALRVAGRTPGQSAAASFPTVDIFHLYTMDQSTNATGSPIDMGMAGLNWSYRVPSSGDPISTGIINPATGNYFTAPAGPADCKLFPLRRYTIFSRTALAYDGSSPYWHGQAPLARLRFADWAWEALGTSLVMDGKSMQDGIVSLMRLIEDSAAARLDPPMIVDDSVAATSWAKAFNPRMAGARASAPVLSAGNPIILPFDPGVYDVPQWILEHIKDQEERMETQAGLKDMIAIAKARQVPGADTLEKLMEMAGPIVRDNVRALARPLWILGEQRKALYFQFYTNARMLTITGPDGIQIDKQYLPEQLVKLQPAESPDARAVRARGYLDEFRYHITESGINEINRMSEKLLYIQLSKIGFPIDWWTLARVNRIPNFGPPPKGTNTVMERWTAQKAMEVDMAAKQAIEMAIAQAEAMAQAQQFGAGGGAPAPGGEPNPDGNAPGEPPPGTGGPNSGGNSGGRPPSFTAPPKLETRDQGTRSTITTS